MKRRIITSLKAAAGFIVALIVVGGILPPMSLPSEALSKLLLVGGIVTD
jgi:hypothetical protein